MSKLKNLIKNKNFKIYVIFGVIVLVLIAAATAVAINLTPKKVEEVKNEAPVDPLVSVKDFNLRIDKYSIEPKEIKIKAKKLYTINVIKDVDAKCSALKNEDLDLQVDIPNSREFPIRFETATTYTMRCIDSGLSFDFKVE